MDVNTFLAAYRKSPTQDNPEAYNPWTDKGFNFCVMEPDSEDWELQVGPVEEHDHYFLKLLDVYEDSYGGHGGEAVVVNEEESGLIFGPGGWCYWTKVGNDIYYKKGSAAVGTSSPRSAQYKFHTEEGHLGAVGTAAAEIWVDSVGVF